MIKEHLPTVQCDKCRGVCCKSFSGGYIPSDFGLTQDNARKQMTLIIARPNVTVTYPQGNYYIRPRLKGELDKFTDKWQGACVHLGIDGCLLPRTEMPTTCKTMRPRKKESQVIRGDIDSDGVWKQIMEANPDDYNCLNEITHQEFRDYWEPYQEILKELHNG